MAIESSQRKAIWLAQWHPERRPRSRRIECDPCKGGVERQLDTALAWNVCAQSDHCPPVGSIT